MRNVVIGFLGTTLDRGHMRGWKPSVGVVRNATLPIDRFELIHDHRHLWLAEQVIRDIAAASPETEVLLHRLDLDDPWDFVEVYGKLFDFARGYGFDEDRERYFVHLSTGTHVAQICWFLLAESRHMPARLIQTGPPPFSRPDSPPPPAKFEVIDLDLSRYDALQQRFDTLAREGSDALKGGIETRNPAYNALIDRLEVIAGASDAPILIEGETGTGKTALAARLHALKLARRRVKGRLVTVNCATLGGDHAQAALFGQRRSHLGVAGTERGGLLREADGGVLFLDEIDELGWRAQGALLSAVETGRFRPIGGDQEVTSRFHLIAGTNRDLRALAAEGRFRPDLLARLGLWRIALPPLRARPEDIEPNLTHELTRAETVLGVRVGFNADARAAFLRFARDPATPWPGNFRDFSGAVLRLATLAARGRITRAMVDAEIAALRADWARGERDADARLVADVLGPAPLDRADLVQLAEVIRVCRTQPTLSAAGRALFAVSRQARTSQNDADRLRKYLARFGLNWDAVRGAG